MVEQPYPLLYSFRRCPYAIRARMGLLGCGVKVWIREIQLRNKPVEMLLASSKATVPVLQLADATVIDESLDIIDWAVALSGDPHQLLDSRCQPDAQRELIAQCDTQFKPALDRYKYADRYPDEALQANRERCRMFLQALQRRLTMQRFLFAERPQLADLAVMPFVRQCAAVDRQWFDHQTDCPALHGWLQHWLASRWFLAAMEKYPLWLETGESPLLDAGDNVTDLGLTG